jgi:hypothetical protein
MTPRQENRTAEKSYSRNTSLCYIWLTCHTDSAVLCRHLTQPVELVDTDTTVLERLSNGSISHKQH